MIRFAEVNDYFVFSAGAHNAVIKLADLPREEIVLIAQVDKEIFGQRRPQVGKVRHLQTQHRNLLAAGLGVALGLELGELMGEAVEEGILHQELGGLIVLTYRTSYLIIALGFETGLDHAIANIRERLCQQVYREANQIIEIGCGEREGDEHEQNSEPENHQ